LGSVAAVVASVPDEVRRRLVLALDFDDSVVALRWAVRMKGAFGVAKVGMELFSAAGPSVVAELVGEGYRVFADLKLADIPNTTYRAARVVGALGASFLTVHAFAGAASLKAGVEGLAAGAEQGGLPPPAVLGVTVLTSEVEAPSEHVGERARFCLQAGCGGLVCAASDLAAAKEAAPGLLAVVPGIRLPGRGRDDHGRAATPAAAARSGADLLVIGRAVTAADDPDGAAREVVGQLLETLSG
jgi:orotidine-5'-phosphate decarboxylase